MNKVIYRTFCCALMVTKIHINDKKQSFMTSLQIEILLHYALSVYTNSIFEQ